MQGNISKANGKHKTLAKTAVIKLKANLKTGKPIKNNWQYLSKP